MQQVVLNFDASPFDGYSTCREYVHRQVYQQGVHLKVIAADMDYSPSQLTRKLTQSPTDSARFTLDDLEVFMQVTGDVTPVYCLVHKHVTGKKNKEALLKLKAEIEAQLKEAS
jgi:hypothetical protein